MTITEAERNKGYWSDGCNGISYQPKSTHACWLYYGEGSKKPTMNVLYPHLHSKLQVMCRTEEVGNESRCLLFHCLHYEPIFMIKQDQNENK